MSLKSKFVKWLTGYDPKTFEAHQNLLKASMVSESSGLNDIYLFDFKNFASQYNGNGLSIITTGGVAGPQQGQDPTDQTPPDTMIGSPNDTNKSVPTKIKVKPIDVLNELETIPTPFTLTLLEEKIEILKDKSKLINQHYAKREVDALIDRLENRKKYIEHKSFFDRYQNTTDEKIDALLKKYELVMKTSDIFIPEFPDDAIRTMKEYDERSMTICGKRTVFYVIAEVQNFKKAYEKRDPILLAQSPFGFYWQILGAWNEEMLILSEL